MEILQPGAVSDLIPVRLEDDVLVGKPLHACKQKTKGLKEPHIDSGKKSHDTRAYFC